MKMMQKLGLLLPSSLQWVKRLGWGGREEEGLLGGSGGFAVLLLGGFGVMVTKLSLSLEKSWRI